MLYNLHIENLAIIESMDIDFSQGLNILSGESGAGKSIIIKSLALLQGNKADKNLIGKFKNFSIIEAAFNIDNLEVLKKLLDAGIFIAEDHLLILTRELHLESKSIARINGRQVSLGLMKEISMILFEIQGQNQHLEFLKKDNYILIMDRFADEKLNKALIEQKKLHGRYLENRRELLQIISDQNHLAREKDIIEYELKEISELDLIHTDFNQLESELKKINNATVIMQSLDQILYIINGLDVRNSGLNNQISSISRIVRDLQSYDSFSNMEEWINTIDAEIQEFYRETEAYRDSIEYDEERLAYLNDIFERLNKLKRKYGPEISDIISYSEQSKARLDFLENSEALHKNLSKEKEILESQLKENSEAITFMRKGVAEYLEDRVQEELKELAMDNVRFHIIITEADKITDLGKDDVEFLFSVNKGDDPKPVQEIASGGEFSRIILAMQSVLANDNDLSTMIFDEIDTGISGRTAQTVGRRFLEISKKMQLIIVSHLPQITAMADSHIFVYKEIDQLFTKSYAKILTYQERIKELSRLLAGNSITKATIKSAEELLTQNKDGL